MPRNKEEREEKKQRKNTKQGHIKTKQKNSMRSFRPSFLPSYYKRCGQTDASIETHQS
jgi:hypothetical protein